jgi:D-threo-aldose 1-dehydrogenase
MFACCVTAYTHDEVATSLLKKLGTQGVDVINSAVFNAGFLIGGSHFDYRQPTLESDPELFHWRDRFHEVCADFGVQPAAACVQFSFLFPEIKSVALATSKAARVASNVDLATAEIPKAFWKKMKAEGLIDI